MNTDSFSLAVSVRFVETMSWQVSAEDTSRLKKYGVWVCPFFFFFFFPSKNVLLLKEDNLQNSSLKYAEIFMNVSSVSLRFSKKTMTIVVESCPHHSMTEFHFRMSSIQDQQHQNILNQIL